MVQYLQAPEVFRHEPYNSSVDVYSYSMIMYQLFEFQPPFAGMDPIEAARQAALYELRPHFIVLLSTSPAKRAVKELIERCWSPDAEVRPTFESIVTSLEEIQASLPKNTERGAKSSGGGSCCALS